MNKFQRIQLVRLLGLNTEESVLISNQRDWHRYRRFLQSFPAYSLRTFGNTWVPGTEPHYPLITRDELVDLYRSLLDSGLQLIVAKAIDPADALLAGCMLYQGESFLVEAALGPVTVRRVTREGYIDLTLEVSSFKPSGNYYLDSAVQEAERGLRALSAKLPMLHLEDLLYEFSIYGKPVGWKNEHVIFWELVGSPSQEDLMEGLLACGSITRRQRIS